MFCLGVNRNYKMSHKIRKSIVSQIAHNKRFQTDIKKIKEEIHILKNLNCPSNYHRLRLLRNNFKLSET